MSLKRTAFNGYQCIKFITVLIEDHSQQPQYCLLLCRNNKILIKMSQFIQGQQEWSSTKTMKMVGQRQSIDGINFKNAFSFNSVNNSQLNQINKKRHFPFNCQYASICFFINDVFLFPDTVCAGAKSQTKIQFGYSQNLLR